MSPRDAGGPPPGRAPRHLSAAATPPPSNVASTGMVTDQAAVLALSDERDRWLHARLGFARYAHQRGYTEGWEAGRRALLEDLATDQRYMLAKLRPVFERPDHAQLERRRWILRGEQRTRETFGQPHPDDYPGQDGAA